MSAPVTSFGSNVPISFVDRSNDRRLPNSFAGDIYIWDIDKTYLDTRFSSVRGLLGIPFEFAVDKRAVPGTVPLLRGLRHGADDESALCPIYFISGSPRELRSVVERKMTLDGVQFDGITFKDQWGLIKARRPRGLLEQVGYKLKALLLYRREHPPGARYVLFGDDIERDLESFLLFGEICAGLRGHDLAARLESMGVHGRDVNEVVSLADTLTVGPDPVRQVFLHEVRGGRVRVTDERVHVAPDFLAHARALRGLGKLRETDVEAVRLDLERSR